MILQKCTIVKPENLAVVIEYFQMRTSVQDQKFCISYRTLRMHSQQTFLNARAHLGLKIFDLVIEIFSLAQL